MNEPLFLKILCKIQIGWTTLAAIDEGMPISVISAALFERFSSRGDADYANRVLSAMRKQFGGHDEKKEGR